MPQLDFIIVSSQIFWLITIFFSLYTILTHFFLPNFIKVLKTRKKLLLENTNKLIDLKNHLSKKNNFFDEIINLKLSKIKILIEKEMSLFFETFVLKNSRLLNKNIANVLYFNLILYDINVLKAISTKVIF